MRTIKSALLGLLLVFGIFESPVTKAQTFDYRKLVADTAKEYLVSGWHGENSEIKRRDISSPWWSNLCDEGLSVQLSLASQHFGTKSRNLNERNLGIGLRCNLNEYAFASGMIVPRNTMRGMTVSFGGGALWPIFQGDSWKLSGGGTVQAGLYENTEANKYVPFVFGGPLLEGCYEKLCGWGLIIPVKNPVLFIGTGWEFW